MPNVPVANTVMVEWRMTLFGQQIENRLHIDNFSPPDQVGLMAFAVAAWNWWQNTYSVDIVEDCNLREVVCTDLSSANSSQAVYAPSTTVNGQLAGDPLPNEVAFCISLHTAFRGRSARGRWYVAGLAVGQRSDANTLDNTVAGNLVSSLQTYINAVATGTPRVIIVSYRTNNAPRVGGPVKFVVTAAAITDLILDSQKRRKPGIGA
jgi:hypothetical protein